MMKRLTVLLLSLLMLCSLAACSAPSAAPADSAPADSTPADSAPASGSLAGDADADTPLDAKNETDPAALLGAWDEAGAVYTNEALQLRYTLPEGWLYASEEELLNLMGLVKESDLLSDRDKLALELNENQLVIAMMAQDPTTGSNIQLSIQDMSAVVGGSAITEEMYAELSLDSIDDSKYQAGETYPAQVDGVEFLAMPLQTEYGGIEIHQTIYLHKLNKKMVLITVTGMGTETEDLAGGFSAFSGL